MSTARILFVCMGNICRSPSAQGAFLKHLGEYVYSEQFQVDSAGTHGYHAGQGADARSRQHAARRGIDLSEHRARQVCIEDFATYDHIFAMDRDNYALLLSLCPQAYQHKIQLYLPAVAHRLPDHLAHYTDVPDPYYGGSDGFETVLDLVEAAAQAWLQNNLKIAGS